MSSKITNEITICVKIRSTKSYEIKVNFQAFVGVKNIIFGGNTPLIQG